MARSPGAGLLLGLISRLGRFLLTLCGVVGLVLALLWLAPGDPIDLLPNGEEVRAQLEADWQLDQPLHRRYLRYLAHAAHGDLGVSLVYRPGTPVWEVIREPALRSLMWVGSALLLAMLWGSALAWFTAGRPERATLHRASAGLVRVVSIAPVFLLAHLVINGLNELTWWGMEQRGWSRPDWFALPMEDSLERTALAVVLLAVGSGALTEIHTELSGALHTIRGSCYVDAARARGAPTWPHVALNLIPPLATLIADRAAFFVGGLVVLEKVFLLNGVGAILWRAALGRDYELALGISLLTAALVASTRLLADLVRMAIDPRIRAGA